LTIFYVVEIGFINPIDFWESLFLVNFEVFLGDGLVIDIMFFYDWIGCIFVFEADGWITVLFLF
jgi:hypothetical protein